LKSYEMRIAEVLTGREVPPVLLPARTTLHVVDLNEDGIRVVTPDGRRVLVSREMVREHGYIPRAA
jgi:hypothetical protein